MRISAVLSSQSRNDDEAIIVTINELLKNRHWDALFELLLRSDCIVSLPIKARESLARLASLDGDHSGSAFSSLVWFSNSLLQSFSDSLSCDGLIFSSHC